MDDFSALSDGERAVLSALNRHGIRYMLVGLSAAVLQGANTGTKGIDIWIEDTADPRVGEAIAEAGGIWISGAFGMRPPQIGGDHVGGRLDIVTHLDGLGRFAAEIHHTVVIDVDGLPLRVLKLERIIDSKRAAGRKRDSAALPALEEALAVVRSAQGPDLPKPS